MNVLMFIVNNWHNILVIGILLITLYLMLTQWVKQVGPIFGNLTFFGKLQYAVQILANLVPIALVLVTDAEIHYGAGTGPIKRSWVIDQLYSRVPDQFKQYITEEDLSLLLEEALKQAKILWDENISVGALLAPIH